MNKIIQSVLQLSVFAILLSISIFSSKIYALDDGVNKADFFPIGVYYVIGQKPVQSDTDDPNDPEYVPLDGDFRYNPTVAENEYFKEFKDLKSYGFNTAIMMINPIVHPAADEERANNIINGLINAAENASMQIVVPMNQTTNLLSAKHEDLTTEQINSALSLDYIDLFMASSATFGYQIFDEPVPLGYGGVYGPAYKEVDTAQLGQVHDVITNLDTNAYALSTWNNINSMELINSEMNPDSILVDLYPFALDAYNGDQADGDTPLGDLSDANPRGNADDGSFHAGVDQPTYTQWLQSTQAIAPNKPVWVAFQAFGGANFWRNPEPKELRLQTFVAIKNGAKGIFYFMYQSESWANGLMDINYQETPLVLEAKSINEKVQALAPTLLKLTLTDNHASAVGAEVQTFTHNNGEKYLIVVNSDVENSSTITVLIDKSWFTNPNGATNIYTNENFTISDENEQYLKLELPIEAADGKVILLKSSMAPQAVVNTNKSIYNPTNKITVTYSGFLGDGDWIAIFPKNAPNENSYIVGENDNGKIITDGSTFGDVTFQSLDLSKLQEKEYEVRAFSNNSFELIASSTFTILENSPSQGTGTTITANKTVYRTSDTITVSYTGMQGNEDGDWLAIFPKDATSAGEFIVDTENDGGWMFTGGTTSGEVTFNSLDLSTLPAGEYEVRAFFNDSYDLEASYSFSIGTSIKTNQTIYKADDKIKVLFERMQGNEDGDWLAIFPKGATSAGEFIVDAENDTGWTFTGGETSGEIIFNSLNIANLHAGEYEVRAFFNDSYNLETFTSFSVKTAISTNKKKYTSNEKITVTFSSFKADVEGDWLAIFPKGAPSAGEFIVNAENDSGWLFTGGTTSGKVTFDSLDLSTLPAGEYEVRAFFNDSYELEASYGFSIGTSLKTDKTTYTMGEKIKVSFEGMVGDEDGDWLAIFPKDATSAGEFIVDAENDGGWLFTGGTTSGEVTFDSLDLSTLPAGEYEVRAFFNDSYELEASYAFTIKNPTVTTNQSIYSANEKVTVIFTGMQGNEDGDWIAIFPKDAPSAGEFIVDAENDGGWIFTEGVVSGQIRFDYLNLADLPSGEYEVRAFFNDSYNVRSTSTFTIE